MEEVTCLCSKDSRGFDCHWDEVVHGGQLRVLGHLHPLCLFRYGSCFPASQVDVGWGKGVWAGGIPD